MKSERKVNPDLIPKPPRLVPVFALSMDDAASALGISKPVAYGLIERGVLKTFCVGKRRLASTAALAAAVAQLEAEEPPMPSTVPNNRRPPTEAA